MPSRTRQPSIVLERRSVTDLLADPRNARTHSPRNITEIATSLRRFGQQKNIVILSDGQVIAGSGTLEAAREIGWEYLDVKVFTGTLDEARAYGITDNRTAELAGWDPGILAELMGGLPPELQQSTAFSEDEIDKMLGRDKPDEPPPTDPDDIPPPPVKPITRPGDVWILGDHRVMCGDARNSEDVARLLDGRTVNVAFTSPPYAEQRDYDKESGFKPIPPDEYVDWFEPVAANIRAHLAEDGSLFVNLKPSAVELDTDLYVFDLVLAMVRSWGWHFATEFCWERVGIPKWIKRRFKNQFEPIYQFAINDWKIRADAVRHASDHVPTNGLGDGFVGNVSAAQGTRKPRKNGVRNGVSEHQGTNWAPGDFTAPGMAYPGNRLPPWQSEATGHPAAFPVALPGFFVLAYSDPGDVVLDPFMGSGSTLIAAHGAQRVAAGMDLSPAYVDITCRRFEAHTGVVPVLERTGKPRRFTRG